MKNRVFVGRTKHQKSRMPAGVSCFLISMDFEKISVFQVGNDGSAVGHDGDGVVVFSLVFQDFLRQLPGFFYGSHGGLVGLFDGFEVFGLGDQDDVVFVGHAEEVEGYEEGDGEMVAQGFFHFFFGVVFEAAHVGRRFVNVAGFHDGDDDAALFGDYVGGVIAFAALVEGYVFGVAAGAGEGYVAFGFEGDFLDAVDDFGAFQPGFVGVAAYHSADFAFGVDDGVNQEAGFNHVAGFLHVVGNGVVRKEGGAGFGVDAAAEFFSQGMAVVDLDGVVSCHAGKNEFSAAAVAGKEVGGNAVDDDDFVRFYGVFVDPYGGAAAGVAYVDQFVLVHAVVLVQFHPLGQFFAYHHDVFFRCLFSVGALGKEDADVFIRYAGQVQFVHHMNDELVRMVPDTGDVGADDADFVSFGDDFLQGFGSNGMTHAFQGGFFDVAGRCGVPFQYVQNMFFRQTDFLGAMAETEFKFF